jgi:hypothetical protein
MQLQSFREITDISVGEYENIPSGRNLAFGWKRCLFQSRESTMS